MLNVVRALMSYVDLAFFSKIGTLTSCNRKNRWSGGSISQIALHVVQDVLFDVYPQSRNLRFLVQVLAQGLSVGLVLWRLEPRPLD